MLQSMRQVAQSWPVKAFMLFVGVSFSVWGIGDVFRGNPLQKTVAKAGNTSISVDQLNHLFEKYLAQARQRVNPSLTAQQARQMGMLDTTLDNQIKADLLDQDIKHLGIEVSPQAVLKFVADQPQFRKKDGSFNKELFQQLLQQQNLSEAAFIAQGQQDMARQTLLHAMDTGGIVPQAAIDALYKARAQKRVLDVVTIDASQLSGIATPDDKALHDFYAANPALFSAPEYRGLTLATLSTDKLAKEIVISDDQLRKEYDAKADQLGHPEQRDVLQVVVQDEAKARQLVQQASKDGDLAAAAKAQKETAIPLDQLQANNLMPELSKPVFAMKVNEISDPIKTQLGWHVLQLKKITPAGKPSFEAAKDKLREDMRRDQAIEAATRIVNQLDDQLAAGHSLDDIADELKLRMIKVGAIDANGLQPDGKAPAELPNKDQVIKDLFAQNSGETSPVEDDKNGTYYVVRTDEVTAAGPKPFDTVKAQVAAAWKAHEQAAKAKEEATIIAKALQDGKPVASFEGREGVTVRESNPLSQLGDSDPLLPPDLIAQAFRLKKGDTTMAVMGSKQIVARLASITDADLKDDPRKNMIVGELKKAASDEMLDQYIQHLYRIFPVSTDMGVLNRMRQQDN